MNVDGLPAMCSRPRAVVRNTQTRTTRRAGVKMDVQIRLKPSTVVWTGRPASATARPIPQTPKHNFSVGGWTQRSSEASGIGAPAPPPPPKPPPPEDSVENCLFCSRLLSWSGFAGRLPGKHQQSLIMENSSQWERAAPHPTSPSARGRGESSAYSHRNTHTHVQFRPLRICTSVLSCF